MKAIKNEKSDEDTRTSLEEVLKDPKVLDALIGEFRRVRAKVAPVAEPKASPNVQEIPEELNKVVSSGKAVVNKSPSEIPEIYK